MFSQKVREWYGWHFPELYAIVSDNITFAKLALYIGNKSTLSEDKLHEVAALVEDDDEKANEIINKAKISMGRDISATDMENVSTFAEKVVKLSEYRRTLFLYLSKPAYLVRFMPDGLVTNPNLP